eukprot:1921853-Rhodomonas_salina.2
MTCPRPPISAAAIPDIPPRPSNPLSRCCPAALHGLFSPSLSLFFSLLATARPFTFKSGVYPPPSASPLLPLLPTPSSVLPSSSLRPAPPTFTQYLGPQVIIALHSEEPTRAEEPRKQQLADHRPSGGRGRVCWDRLRSAGGGSYEDAAQRFSWLLSWRRSTALNVLTAPHPSLRSAHARTHTDEAPSPALKNYHRECLFATSRTTTGVFVCIGASVNLTRALDDIGFGS